MLNRERVYERVSIVGALLSIGLIFMPGLVGMDGMDGGYAISFVAAFAAICGVVLTFVFHRRAGIVDRLLEGRDLLAQWTYEPDEWARYTESEATARPAERLGPFLLVAGWSLLFGLLFFFMDREAGGAVAAVMLAVTLLTGVMAFVVPRLWAARRRRSPGNAWVSPKAAYFDGALYRWDTEASRLQSAEHLSADGAAPDCLCVLLGVITRVGRQTYTVRIPVPVGLEAEAAGIPGTLVSE